MANDKNCHDHDPHDHHYFRKFCVTHDETVT